jgi:hypothetical protein
VAPDIKTPHNSFQNIMKERARDLSLLPLGIVVFFIGEKSFQLIFQVNFPS